MGMIMKKNHLHALVIAISVLGLGFTVPAGGFAAPVKQKQKQRPKQAAASMAAYKADRIVTIDFSAIDPQKSAAIPVPDKQADVQQKPGLWPFFAKSTVSAEQNIATTLIRFYSNNPALLWSGAGGITPRTRNVLAALAKAGEDGLKPQEYLPALPDDSLEGEDRIQALVDFDVRLSARLLRYVQDAGAGRLVANRLTRFHDLPRHGIDLDAALALLAGADNPADVLARYQPQSSWYAALKRELAGLEKKPEDSLPLIVPGKAIRPGDSHPQFPQMVTMMKNRLSGKDMEKFSAVLAGYENAATYDVRLKPFVQAYQKSAGKVADGVIGRATMAALQGMSHGQRRAQVLYAMERLRWLPHDFSPRYVFINTPAYQAQYFEAGKEKLMMKVVVGSAHNQTSFFYDTISQVVFNPYWGVPQSIVRKEMVPHIQADPSYLARRGYEIYDRRGRRIAANSVNWQSVAARGGVNIRQRPGAGNALGELKILFPNKHDIYLHDTPAKGAFSRDMRAISHGCVRLADPRAMAAAVMGTDTKALARYFGRNERVIKVNEPLPVYLGYFTAWPDAVTGKIAYYDDVYGWDKAMATADAVIERSRAAEKQEQQASSVMKVESL
ncbi:MAG: Peptidoglycan-binding domain-containing protein [Candidatus Tokpelaia hoelldobleri]|uniref:Peptidoglycan-binding domain-containing protein n=1 Tax=Candidatus Tokpelaia hoelldobleri TaxID=1902579 RepID=A0A1U9JTX4_9HYPH|nr:MAG: Peptidoglycan-binding domain-containing protein [Candidatus Tokpelaia hoelldoblerii]